MHFLVGNSIASTTLIAQSLLYFLEKNLTMPLMQGKIIRSSGGIELHLLVVSGATMKKNSQAKICHPINPQQSPLWQLLNTHFAVVVGSVRHAIIKRWFNLPITYSSPI
ncbi:hypothetical protein [Desulforhopalus sp. 52FAK]